MKIEKSVFDFETPFRLQAAIRKTRPHYNILITISPSPFFMTNDVKKNHMQIYCFNYNKLVYANYVSITIWVQDLVDNIVILFIQVIE